MAASPVDVLIIGGGPAGLTAALTLSRQLHTAVLFDNHSYRNGDAPHMHMVPSWDHNSPAEFRSQAREEILTHYSTVQIEDVEIMKAEKINDSLFQVTDGTRVWQGRKLIIATGSEDMYPDVPGYREAWGKRIFHCLFCKGYEDRNAHTAGVLAVQSAANVPMAIHQAENAAQLASTITIYTDGAEELGTQLTAALSSHKDTTFKVDNRKIVNLSVLQAESTSDAKAIQLQLEDSVKEETFLVHNPLTKLKGPFAEHLGVELSPALVPGTGDIAASAPFHQTSVRGVFAAGDCITPYKVVAGAISSGCNAAVAASAQLLAEKHGHQPLF